MHSTRKALLLTVALVVFSAHKLDSTDSTDIANLFNWTTIETNEKPNDSAAQSVVSNMPKETSRSRFDELLLDRSNATSARRLCQTLDDGKLRKTYN